MKAGFLNHIIWVVFVNLQIFVNFLPIHTARLSACLRCTLGLKAPREGVQQLCRQVVSPCWLRDCRPLEDSMWKIRVTVGAHHVIRKSQMDFSCVICINRPSLPPFRFASVYIPFVGHYMCVSKNICKATSLLDSLNNQFLLQISQSLLSHCIRLSSRRLRRSNTTKQILGVQATCFNQTIICMRSSYSGTSFLQDDIHSLLKGVFSCFSSLCLHKSSRDSK